MKIVDDLRKAGLTKREARTYVGLLELQETKTGDLCEHTDIASSNIYTILDSLIEKGLASYRMQNNTKIYMPAPPETIDDLFQKQIEELKEEREEAKQLINDLKQKEKQEEAYSNYKYYEAITGMKSMWHEINDVMSPEHTVKVYTTRPEAYKNLFGFLDTHHEKRKEKRVHERLLLDPSNELAEKRNNEITEIRFTSLETDAEWGVLGDHVYMQYIAAKVPRGFLIKDAKFAETFAEAFSKVWEQAEPYEG